MQMRRLGTYRVAGGGSMESTRLLLTQGGGGGRGLRPMSASSVRGDNSAQLQLCVVQGAAFKRMDPFMMSSRWLWWWWLWWLWLWLWLWLWWWWLWWLWS